mmetsp:Transcript_8208/g.4342  ORF Transcript_8208/g.4342 Transcript_8208/m.4342 type:complete len:80 (+) Transcript_8208:626-865(+)
MYYTGGILDGDCSGEYLDHDIGCVGYGEENGVKFFILRNSWGTSWGEEGYMRVLRTDSTTDYGLCGIAEMVYYPDSFIY